MVPLIVKASEIHIDIIVYIDKSNPDLERLSKFPYQENEKSLKQERFFSGPIEVEVPKAKMRLKK